MRCSAASGCSPSSNWRRWRSRSSACTTAAGVTPGLFPIRATGVSTAPIVDAANAFLATLTPAQTIRTIFAVDDAEWRRWSNVDNGLYTRQGVSLREMSDAQRAAAMALLRVSLSAKGLALSQNIMKTDQVLREVNDDALRYDEQLYFFTVMGRPSATEPWGWQIDGHHLIVNYFVLGDQVVMTPVFMGGGTGGGDHRQVRRQRGHAARAGSGPRLHARPRTVAAAGRDHPARQARQRHPGPGRQRQPGHRLPRREGVDAPAAAQRRSCWRWSASTSGNLRDGARGGAHARGGARTSTTPGSRGSAAPSDDAVFYYRIHSPVILIEFDHQLPVGTTSLVPRDRPTRGHIHTMVRTPNGNDYGKDLLRQHLAAHPH